jgi:DNA repair photolyase
MTDAGKPVRGRGAPANPGPRFEQLAFEPDPAELTEEDVQALQRTRFLRDASRSVISRNSSPDIPFDASLNPYRGCEHGCSYCYARPTHEYLGLSAGLDFERVILVKEDAPQLLERELRSPKWKPQTLMLSGVTDPYQPVERHLRITRGCLELLRAYRNPVSIITKNHLVTRDVDVLAELAALGAARVHLSITTLDEELRRLLEPRTATAARRLEALRVLAEAGVPVGVAIAPVIPGLNDHEIPRIIEAAAAAGASSAFMIPLRLPGAVEELFSDWLAAHYPDRKDKVLGRVRQIRGGQLNESAFGTRMRGQGEYAAQLRALFQVTARRHGLATRVPLLSSRHFRVPGVSQPRLFEGS